MVKTVAIDKVYSTLKKYVKDLPVPVVELIETQTKDPFKVLVTTILSARTKDQTTMEVVKKLFAKVKKVSDFNKYSEKQIVELIYPIGFYNTKAKHLKKLPSVLKEEFSGKIPSTIEELIKLPGVGRKTANLVVAVAFGKPAIAVDVHCHRIPQRLGWFVSKTPFETEQKLNKLFPKRIWKDVNAVFVAFGQGICRPVSPKCNLCPVSSYCKYYKTIFLKK